MPPPTDINYSVHVSSWCLCRCAGSIYEYPPSLLIGDTTTELKTYRLHLNTVNSISIDYQLNTRCNLEHSCAILAAFWTTQFLVCSYQHWALAMIFRVTIVWRLRAHGIRSTCDCCCCHVHYMNLYTDTKRPQGKLYENHWRETRLITTPLTICLVVIQVYFYTVD